MKHVGNKIHTDLFLVQIYNDRQDKIIIWQINQKFKAEKCFSN